MPPISPRRALVIVLPGVLLFAVLAAIVQSGHATAMDLAVSGWMERHQHPWATRLLFLLTNWHQTAGVLLMAAAVLAWLLRLRERLWAVALVAAVPGGMLLNVLLKLAFQRARPAFDVPLVHLLTYSFPSGHTLGATVFYGFLATWLWRHAAGRPARAALAGGAVLMIALVALSRVYLGAHYPTDVLAAMAEGCVWLTICLTVISNWRRPPAGAPPASS